MGRGEHSVVYRDTRELSSLWELWTDALAKTQERLGKCVWVKS